ncbi:hypothetical protein QBZ16_001712 [Prototheca wickerhamii]|uniref:Uncharacterized protein n=1 Tax=Prototheca wickerhamii TaxID=3111 RepID=A0AAD9ID24_PROWI|nr:hypothetical protein QBZ16_001712 [Prototheca wickerhamii]
MAAPLYALPVEAQQAAIQSILSRMTPQERHQLGAMPPPQQRAALEELHRRHLLAARQQALAMQQQQQQRQAGPAGFAAPPQHQMGGQGAGGAEGRYSPAPGAGVHHPLAQHARPYAGGAPSSPASQQPQQLDAQRAARLQSFLATLPASVKARVAELPREQQATALVRLLQHHQQQQMQAQGRS